jgi:uncharacterized protein
LIQSLWKAFRPHLLVAVSDFPPVLDTPRLVQDRPLVNGLPTAYVCRRFVCQKPTNSVQELEAQLEARI